MYFNNNHDNDVDYLIHMPIDLTSTPVCAVLCDRTFNKVSEFATFSDLCLPLLVGSCSGIFCLNDYIEDVLIYLWNPTIRKFKRLPVAVPDCDIYFDWFATGFAYMPQINDYKVVHITFLLYENEKNTKQNVRPWLKFTHLAQTHGEELKSH